MLSEDYRKRFVAAAGRTRKKGRGRVGKGAPTKGGKGVGTEKTCPSPVLPSPHNHPLAIKKAELTRYHRRDWITAAQTDPRRRTI